MCARGHLFARLVAPLCAQPEVQCAKSPVLSVHLCIRTACNVYYVLCANLRTARKVLCIFALHCVQSLRMACIYGCMFAQLCTRPRRLTKIYILSATGYLLQPCCQLEMQLTLSLCLLSGTCYTIDYCHPLSSPITQNSLFISYYYMLTSALSVLCPPSPSQEFELEASQSEHFFFL